MNWNSTNNKNISSRPNQKPVQMLKNEKNKLNFLKKISTKEERQLASKQLRTPIKDEKQ